MTASNRQKYVPISFQFISPSSFKNWSSIFSNELIENVFHLNGNELGINLIRFRIIYKAGSLFINSSIVWFLKSPLGPNKSHS